MFADEIHAARYVRKAHTQSVAPFVVLAGRPDRLAGRGGGADRRAPGRAPAPAAGWGQRRATGRAAHVRLGRRGPARGAVGARGLSRAGGRGHRRRPRHRAQRRRSSSGWRPDARRARLAHRGGRGAAPHVFVRRLGGRPEPTRADLRRGDDRGASSHAAAAAAGGRGDARGHAASVRVPGLPGEPAELLGGRLSVGD